MKLKHGSNFLFHWLQRFWYTGSSCIKRLFKLDHRSVSQVYFNQGVKRGGLENCKTEPKKIKVVLNDDVMCLILQCLRVISLLRLRLVCRTWRALIESNDFIKQHVHHHHYDPNLKDKNHSLINPAAGKGSPFTFSLISIDSFEVPNTCIQLDCSDLRGQTPYSIIDIVSYNGIVCLNLASRNLKHSIWLWNPVTKQSRVLPQLPIGSLVGTTIGFGFDVEGKGYKVVNLIKTFYSGGEKRVDVYSLNTSSWRRITTVIPFGIIIGNAKMPFNNGTCFFWLAYNYAEDIGILCFDFCSELFRAISLPCAGYFPLFHHIKLVSVVCDKIAFVLEANDVQIEIWVFNEYGTAKESWTKLYRVDAYSVVDRQMRIEGISMNGKYIFFRKSGQMCRFNVVTQETVCFTVKNLPFSLGNYMVEFKESLVSVMDA